MDKLKGKVVWITGASSGIGEALAYAFANEGAILILSARRSSELEKVKEQCKGAMEVALLPFDLEKPFELPQKVEWVMKKFESLDILIHCAGLSQRSFAKDTSMDVYRRIMEINYFGTIQLSLAVLPFFQQKNKGQFVVMSSVTGKVGLPLRTAYSAAKHALEGFFSALRTETWRTGIKILIVRAGAVKTNIAANALTGDGTAFNKKDIIIDKGISAEGCAKAILAAVVEGRKHLMVGSVREKFLMKLHAFLPEVAFNFIKKLAD